MSDTITLPRAAAQQALHVATAAGYPVALIATLKTALEQPEQDQPEQDTDCHAQGICQRSGYGIGKPEQEPFGYIWPTGRHPEFRYTQQMRDGVAGMPLYTHPPRREWQSLTEEETSLVCKKARDDTEAGWPHGPSYVERVICGIDAALKEKNHE
jgi:hypothetical protein